MHKTHIDGSVIICEKSADTQETASLSSINKKSPHEMGYDGFFVCNYMLITVNNRFY